MIGERRAFAIGTIVGMGGGVLVLLAPPIGVAIIVLASIARPRPMTASGVLIGAAVASGALLLVAGSSCTAAAGCTAPDLTVWVVLVAAAFGFGGLLALVAVGFVHR